MRKVFITRRLPSIALELLREHFEVAQAAENEPYPRNQLAQLAIEYDAILSTVSETFDAAILRQRDRLQVISNYAAGVDNIDVDAARSVGIAVYSTPGAGTNSTADLTFALLLALLRQLPRAQHFVRAGAWQQWDPELFLGEELFGKTLGILGFGRIGQAVARRAIGFGLDVIYYTRGTRPVDAWLSQHARRVSFDDLLASADYLSIHVPLTHETQGLINKQTLARMRRNCVLVNMARGGAIVTDDLVEALVAGTIRGCALDVTSPEPLPADHPLCTLDNVLIVPHVGTATLECRTTMARMAAQNIITHFGQDGGSRPRGLAETSH